MHNVAIMHLNDGTLMYHAKIRCLSQIETLTKKYISRVYIEKL